MASLNKVMLIGNLTRDPQLKYLPNQTAICEFGLAVSRKFKSASGEMRGDCFSVKRQNMMPRLAVRGDQRGISRFIWQIIAKTDRKGVNFA